MRNQLKKGLIVTASLAAVLVICLLAGNWRSRPSLPAVGAAADGGPPWLISCLGDSITNGFPYAGTAKTYPAQLQAVLEDTFGSGRFSVANHGVVGYRADLENLDWMADDTQVVLLLVGGNDLAQEVLPGGSNLPEVIEQTVAEVQAIVDLVRSHTNGDGSAPQIITSAMIPVFTQPASAAVFAYNTSLANDLEGVDLWFTANWDDFYDANTQQARLSLMFDAVHPNAAGYAVMAENWFEAMDPLVPAPPNLLVHPYLGETTSNSVVVSWATDSSGASEVRYSPDQSYDSVAPAASAAHDNIYWHSAVITGLTARASTYYQIYTAGSNLSPSSEITFTTAPAPNATHFSFAVVGDSRPDSASSSPSQGALDVAAEMGRRSPHLALHTGDMVYSGGVCTGSDSAWRQYVRAYLNLHQDTLGSTPIYPSVGNHELSGGSCGYESYTSIFSLPAGAPAVDEEQYYAFDWGNAHFAALDTNQSYAPGSPQYAWLIDDLESNTQAWTFVFFHHPAYSSGNHGSTGEVQTYLAPLFETYGVDMVFNGHDHHYERSWPILDGACVPSGESGGVVYVVTGGAGAPLYDVNGDWFTAHADSRYHLIEVEIDDCLLRLEAVDASGAVFDSYEIDRCSGSSPAPHGLWLPMVAGGQ